MSLWAAVERKSGRAVALAGLQWEEIDGRRELDLGCVVADHARRRRFATEASAAVVAAAFAAGFDRITAMTGLDNAAFFVRRPGARGTHAAPRASAAGEEPPVSRS